MIHFQVLLSIKKDDKPCEQCGSSSPFQEKITWRNSDRSLTNSCRKCFTRLTGTSKPPHQANYEIALRKQLEGKNLTHWDRKIISVYEDWRDGNATYDLLISTGKEIQREKDEWKRKKGYI